MAVLGLQSYGSSIQFSGTPLHFGIYWIGHKGYAIVLVVYKMLDTCTQHTAQHDLHWCISFNWCNIHCEIFFSLFRRLHHHGHDKTLLNCRATISHDDSGKPCRVANREKETARVKVFVRKREWKLQSTEKYTVWGNVLNENKWFAQHVVHGTEYQ